MESIEAIHEKSARVAKKRKHLGKNRKGGIEGLPLQLMIIIIIATLGVSVMIGWMNSIETPKYIGSVTSDPEIVDASDAGLAISVAVTYQDGNPLEGAVVSLNGCGIRDANGDSVNGITGKDGIAHFEDLRINRIAGTGYIDVTAVKPDFGEKKTQIVVVP